MAIIERDCAGCEMYGKCAVFCYQVRSTEGARVWDRERSCWAMVKEGDPRELTISPTPAESWPIRAGQAFDYYIVGQVRESLCDIPG